MSAWPLVLVLSIGCSDTNFGRAQTTDEFEQAPSNEVDILWVIDNSVSMANEQASVASGANDFLARLETTEMDFHLGVVNTDMDDDNPNAGALIGNPPLITSECRSDGDSSDCTYSDQFRARVLQGTNGSDKEKGLQAALSAVSPPLSDTRNAGFLRPDALLSIVILSDENDCSDGGRLGSTANGADCYEQWEQLSSVSDIVADLRATKADPSRIRVSGIVGLEQAVSCDQAVPGSRYWDVIAVMAGVRADICEADYSPIMDALGEIASGILTTFQLEHAAYLDKDHPIEVEVTEPGGEPVLVLEDPANGWTYLADYAQIQFNGDSVPARGSHIEVSYYIAGPVPDPPTDTGTTTP